MRLVMWCRVTYWKSLRLLVSKLVVHGISCIGEPASVASTVVAKRIDSDREIVALRCSSTDV